MSEMNRSAITLTQRLSEGDLPEAGESSLNLALTAEERVRSRHRFTTPQGQVIFLRLPRGTVLQHGDVLTTEAGDTLVQIVAKAEPVFTITAAHPLDLLRAAYHLGNRHVPVEVAPTYLRIAPDPVLRDMLTCQGLTLSESICPFYPETGAYGHTHPDPH